MNEGDRQDVLALAVTPGFIDLFPELEDGTDLGVVEYFAPGTESDVDLIGDADSGAA
jgi:hypothetical protein